MLAPLKGKLRKVTVGGKNWADQEVFASEMTDLAARLNVSLPGDAVLAKLGCFFELTRLWNERTNLVGSKTEIELRDVLFADALVAATLRAFAGARTFVDVGSGGGAPALPLLLLLPDTRCAMVEPRRKRVEFLELLVGELGVGDRVRIHQGKVENPQILDEIKQMKPDVALSRATFPPVKWLPLGGRLAPQVLVFTTPELALDAPRGYRREEAREYFLPTTEARRALYCYSVRH